MSGHHPWSEIKHKARPGIERCKKLNIDGQVCGKVAGMCIHKYIPTLFGDRPQAKHNPKGTHA